MELDIDELSDEVLYKLFQFVQKYAPGESTIKEPKASRPKAHQETRAPAKAKKNKPMNKLEQEARINELQSKLKSYQNQGSGESPEPRESYSGLQRDLMTDDCQTNNPTMPNPATMTTRAGLRVRRSRRLDSCPTCSRLCVGYLAYMLQRCAECSYR